MADKQELKAQLRTSIKERLSNLSPRIGIYLSMPSGEAQTNELIRDALETGKGVYVPYLHSPNQAVSGEANDKKESEQKKGKKRKIMSMLRLQSLEEYRCLAKDSWGIPTLPSDGIESRENAMGGKGLGEMTSLAEDDAVDMIVMPGVAFDTQMNRMGHGAGFYDKFLARFYNDGNRNKPFLVGLCLAEQVLPVGQELEMQEWDWKVDAVAVGDGRLLRR